MSGMNRKNEDKNWTNIEVTEGGSSEELESLVLDLNAPEETDGAKSAQARQVYAPRRELLTKSNTQRDEEDSKEISKETPPEDEVDLEDRPKPNRAARRIKNLLGERNQYASLVQQQQEVIKELSSKLKGTEKQNISSQKDQWERAVNEHERALEQAMEENDPKAVAKATKELADAQMRFSAMKAVEEDFDETPNVPELPQVKQPGPPEAATEWVERNPWFFKDQKAHLLARTLSSELTNEGKFDPESDEYWDELDSRLAKYNIKAAQRKGAARKEPEAEEEVEEAPQVRNTARRKGSPISSSRSGDDEFDTQFSRKGNNVQANPTKDDVDMADRMGVSLKDYMREKYKYASQNYKGYVPIDIT